jgi:integrase
MIEDYLTFCAAAGLRPATIKLRRYWLTRAEHTFGLLGATRGELVAWLALHQWAPETRKSARGALRSFYRWAHAEGLLDHDPSSSLPAVRVPPGTPNPAPTDVLTRALMRASVRNRLIISLAAFAGLRRTEIAELPWSAVSTAWLRIAGKGGRCRTVPLLPCLVEQLTAEQELRDRGLLGDGWRYSVDPSSPYILPGLRGEHMSPETVGAILSRALGPGWHGHTLRHRFATKAYAVERDLLTVQQLLGHSNPQTTARYTAISPDAARAAVAGVAA